MSHLLAKHEVFQELYFTVDKGKLLTPPTRKQSHQNNAALRVYWLSRQNQTNVWRCYLQFASAN